MASLLSIIDPRTDCSAPSSWGGTRPLGPPAGPKSSSTDLGPWNSATVTLAPPLERDFFCDSRAAGATVARNHIAVIFEARPRRRQMPPHRSGDEVLPPTDATRAAR